MPVGHIPKVENWEGCLQWPSPSLQHLLDYTVLSEETRGTYRPYLVRLNLNCPEVNISGYLLWMGNSQSNPKQSSVLRHLFPPFNCSYGHSEAYKSELLCSDEKPLEGTAGAKQHLISVLGHEVNQRWNREPLEPWIKQTRVLGLGHGIRKEEGGTRPPTLWVTNSVGKAAQLPKPFGCMCAKQIAVPPGRCLPKDNCMGSYGRWVKLLRTKESFQAGGLNSLGRQDLLKLLNILLITMFGAISTLDKTMTRLTLSAQCDVPYVALPL